MIGEDECEVESGGPEMLKCRLPFFGTSRPIETVLAGHERLLGSKRSCPDVASGRRDDWHGQ